MLPKEVPPSISTEQFSQFARNTNSQPFNFATKAAHLGTHSLSRPGGARRPLHIVNPFNYTNLALSVKERWQKINHIISSSQFSISQPTPDQAARRALVPAKNTKAELTDKKIETRSRGKFILKIDINRFYPSIYTHSIGWAVEGKTTAKANRRGRSAGNDLDKFSRECQDDQTMGIPIGPDTSLVISELIASRIDERLSNEGFYGFRFMDDYEIVCPTRLQAERALDHFFAASSEYCLAPNPIKTKIYELPIEFTDRWTRKLANFVFSDKPRLQRLDTIQYFELAFQLHRKFPEQGILPYAIKRLQQVELEDSAWPTCRSLICQCILAEPACVRYSSAILHRYESSTVANEVKDALNSIIFMHGSFDHGSEVAWAIFLCQQLNIQITPEATNALAKSRDPIVRVSACFAATNVIRDTSPLHAWKADVTATDSLKKEYWLLAYEAHRRDWNFLVAANGSPIQADANFSSASSADVSFLVDPQTLVNGATDVSHDPYSDDDDETFSTAEEESPDSSDPAQINDRDFPF